RVNFHANRHPRPSRSREGLKPVVPDKPTPRHSASFDLAGALADAAIAAFIAFGLFALMLGLRTDPGASGRLEVFPRPGLLAGAVATVFVGRLLMAIITRSRIASELTRPMQSARPKLESLGIYVAPLLLGFALVTPVLFYSNRYFLDLGILVLT